MFEIYTSAERLAGHKDIHPHTNSSAFWFRRSLQCMMQVPRI
jgi:hypothetical protein